MGSSTNGTGVWALLQSGDKLGVFPRLITVPGYTSQMANSVETITITTVGKGYVPGTSYLITFTAGGVSPTIVQASGHAVANAGGEIHQADLVLDTLGAFYTEAPTVAIAAPPEPVAATLTAGLGGGNVLSNLFIGTVGQGYTPNEVYDITFSGGGSDPGKVLPVAHATADKYGAIDQGQLSIDSAGANLTAAPTATLPAPPAAVPATATATLSVGGNPVVVNARCDPQPDPRPRHRRVRWHQRAKRLGLARD